MLPDFDPRGFLPWHAPSMSDYWLLDWSPFQATPEFLVDRFATSAERCRLLKGLFDWRHQLKQTALSKGEVVQWLNGSFVSDIMALESREPRDIDAVTIYKLDEDGLTEQQVDEIVSLLGGAGDHEQHGFIKSKYHVDSYQVGLLSSSLWVTLKQLNYWAGFWGHARESDGGARKGFVQIRLDADDGPALELLDEKQRQYAEGGAS